MWCLLAFLFRNTTRNKKGSRGPGLAEVHRLPPAVPVVHSEVAPELSILLCLKTAKKNRSLPHRKTGR